VPYLMFRRLPLLALTVAVRCASLEVDELLEIVYAAEVEYPEDDWATLACRFRKLVYSGIEWDLLIPASAATPVLVAKGSLTQGMIATMSQGNLNLNGGLASSTLGPDVNHMFVGIDACAHPRMSLAYRAALLGWWGVKGNLGPVTWAGDVGSVLAEKAFDTIGDEALYWPDTYWAWFAGDDDMAGNFDAPAIFSMTQEDGIHDDTAPLSERLRLYYQGDEAQNREPLFYQRTHRAVAHYRWPLSGADSTLGSVGVRDAKSQIRAMAAALTFLYKFIFCPLPPATWEEAACFFEAFTADELQWTEEQFIAKVNSWLLEESER